MKNFVIDTNVLLQNPDAIYSFEENTVIIPIGVIEELDKFKKDSGDLGRNSRQASRILDSYREKGDLREGVDIADYREGKIRVIYNGNLGTYKKEKDVDYHVLNIAQVVQKDEPERECIVVSRDINVRLKANALGLGASGYKANEICVKTDLDDGFEVKKVGRIAYGELSLNGECPSDMVFDEDNVPWANYYVLIEGPDKSSKKINARVSFDRSTVEVIPKCPPELKIKPKNKEQAFAMDALLDQDIKLVCLLGKAGAGKSLLATAAGEYLVEQLGIYDKMLISRPIQPMGKDLGFLPGDVSEKLDPWMQPIYDALEIIHNKNGSQMNGKKLSGKKIAEQSDKIALEPLTYIRGRSIHNQYLIVDECFPYDQKIATEEGKIKIGTLNSMFHRGDNLPLVKTFNEETKDFEFKRIVSVMSKGEKKLIEIRCANRKIKVTNNHPFLTSKGWIKSGNLCEGDLIMTSESNSHQVLKALNEDQVQIVLGSFLGDGHISNHGNKRYRLKVVHGASQSHYCSWKANMFNSKLDFIEENGYSKKPAYRFVSKIFALDKNLPKNKSYCPQWVLDRMDERALVIMFMDDGHAFPNFNGARIYTSSFDMDSNVRICERINNFGVDCKVLVERKKDGRSFPYISISKSGYENLCRIVAKYIPISELNYKFNLTQTEVYDWNGDFENFGYTIVDKVSNTDSIEEVFDIEVEDNHNFIICSSSAGKNKTNSGLIVHNCQNLMPLEIKTIITRAGENTKIILTGDIEQIDNPYLDMKSNGLSYVLGAFADSRYAAHIILKDGVRSILSEEAAKRL